jgi:hypothetical protein
MASGTKRLIVNTRERAVSNDLNRLQTFKDADLAELLRYIGGVSGFADTWTGDLSESLLPNTNGLVVNGLLVSPINGTLSLLVSPGIALLNATGDADDSVWKFVRDPGVSVAGALTIAAGGGGGIRIDVIEVQVLDYIAEYSSRDVFDPSTGLFAATTVNKVGQARLSYRVRSSVAPGTGYPGTVNGWLPLAAISVPATAVSLDDCVMWDLRPLWKDAATGLYRDARDSVRVRRLQQYMEEAYTTPTTCYCIVHDEGEALFNTVQGYAGNINGSKIDLWLSSTNPLSIWENGLTAFTDKRPWYVWACYPAGIRNWRKYTATGTRRPWGHPGILTLSQTPPTWQGYPSTLIAVPENTGLYLATSYANIVACGLTGIPDGGAVSLPSAGLGDGNWIYPAMSDASLAHVHAAMPSGTFIGESLYALTDNVYFPANAHAIKVSVWRSFSTAKIAGLSRVRAIVYSAGVTKTGWKLAAPMFTGAYVYQVVEIEIPLLPPAFDPTTPAITRVIGLEWFGDIYPSGAPLPTLDEEFIQVTAWRMTP